MLRPPERWEGADVEIAPSEIGPAFEREHAVRDPYVFDTDGARWMLYAAAGESTLGAVRLPAERMQTS